MPDSVGGAVWLRPRTLPLTNVGLTAARFTRKLLMVDCVREAGGVGVSGCRGVGGKGRSLRLRQRKHTKLYGEVEISCETRYFVYLRRYVLL